MKIKFKDCKKKYGEHIVFEDVNLELENGIYHIVGANGTGKSVLCRCVLNLEKFSKGTITGREMPTLFLPDTSIGEKWMSMRENIDLLLYYYQISLSEDEIATIMEKVRIQEPDQNYSQVSVGTAMKMGLFLIFVKDFWKFIVLDETLSHLDREIREIILKEINERAKEGTMIFIVDHNLNKPVDAKRWNWLEIKENKIVLKSN